METRPFGSTGERVSVIGLGGAGLPQHSFADGVATVRRALELGVTYFDTSPFYGRGMSQAIYGEALEGRTEPHLLATKLGHLARPERFRSAEALHAQLEGNLRLLRRDRVDVLQVHEADWHVWWSDDESAERRIDPDRDYDFAGAPVMRVLRDARADGLCRFTGVTGNSAGRVGRVLADLTVDLCLLAFEYDTLHRATRVHVLPVASQQRAAVVLGGVLKAGPLVEIPDARINDPPGWLSPEARPRLAGLRRLVSDSGLSVVELTLRYLLADPDVSTILVGAATPDEIEQDVTAARAGPLPADLHRAVEDLGAP